jgi:hypothetical protein
MLMRQVRRYGISFRGDVLLLVYLLALAVCTAWAAMETGSPL